MKTISVALSFLFLTVTVNGFTQTLFTGHWKVKEKNHVGGPEYSNALQEEMMIDIVKDSLIVSSISTGGNGENIRSRISYSLNGSQSVNTSVTSKRKHVRSCLMSADKSMITLTTIFYMPGNENEVDFTRVEIWKMEKGQLLINKKSIETNNDTWEVKGVFERL
ncbi:MAG: hypothetical protein GXC73_15825 [Chitinophagaceae bacterium]|nr:hypothetical protein [Chitinophagaceae bacterium]